MLGWRLVSERPGRILRAAGEPRPRPCPHLPLQAESTPFLRASGISDLPSCLSQVPSSGAGLGAGLGSSPAFLHASFALLYPPTIERDSESPSLGTNLVPSSGLHPASLGEGIERIFWPAKEVGVDQLLGDQIRGEDRVSTTPNSIWLSKSSPTFPLPVSHPEYKSSLAGPPLYPTPTAHRQRVLEKAQGQGLLSQHKRRGRDAPDAPGRCLEWGWGRVWKMVQGPQPHASPPFPREDRLCPAVVWLPGSPPQPGPRPRLPPAGSRSYI